MRRNARPRFLLFLAVFILLEGIGDAWADSTPSVIRAEEIEGLFDAYLAENDLNPDLISVAYELPASGKRWYHQEDRWYYSASLYKVPMMMLLAEREYRGELTKDSEINGMTLEEIEEEVLVYSNNPVAYSTMLSIAQPDACRRMFCRYSDLPEEYYTWDFYGGSFFTARFMTDVMGTLYRNEEQFPRITDCLKRAQPNHYFRLKLGDRWEIAQKYGTYQDEDGTDWNHTSGIVYTPRPFILTVMTRYGGMSETIIGDLASLFCDYTLGLEQRLRSAEETERVTEAQPSEALPSEALPTPVSLQNTEDESGTGSAAEASEIKEEDPLIGRPALIGAALGLELLLSGLALRTRLRRAEGKKRRRKQ